MYVRMYVCVYVCVSVCEYLPMYLGVFFSICMCICAYVHICIYIHEEIYTQKERDKYVSTPPLLPLRSLSFSLSRACSVCASLSSLPVSLSLSLMVQE